MQVVHDFLKSRANAALVGCLQRGIAEAENASKRASLAHVLTAVMDDPDVIGQLSPEVREAAKAGLAARILEHEAAKEGEAGVLSFSLADMVLPAVALAERCGAERVSPLVFLAASLTVDFRRDAESAKVQEMLRRAGLDLEKVMVAAPADSGKLRRADFTYKSLGFGVDLTAMARAGYWPSCPLVGLDRELKHLVVTISSSVNSVVIVGEPGVGKSALVNGLAWHLANKTRPLIPPTMDDWTVVALSPMNLLSGTGGRGQLEERLDEVLAFFRKNPNVIPFFDEIHTLLDTDDPTARTIATALKPPMATGQFRCIGATTDQEYARYIVADEAMSSRFDRILIPEPDVDTAFTIIHGSLDGILAGGGRKHGVSVDDEAIRAAIRITSQYQKGDRLPRKALRLLNRAVAETVYRKQVQADEASVIGRERIAEVFSELTGIPVSELDTDRPEYYRTISDRMTQKVRGQDPAVNAVTSWLSIHSSGWVDPRRPRGRFLFLGPPGVGKTQLALTLADEVMRDRGSMIVKSMAEYKGEGAKSRFMGADPGYVGFGQTATVYTRVLMRPYSVVVLDEFEKAHPELGDPLLGVLDGSGEDSHGRRVDFSQCIFVMTSNALQDLAHLDLDEDDLRSRLLDMGGIFTPPLIDRLDRVVIFRPLDADVLDEILDGLIAERRSQARRPLPEILDSPEARRLILSWATGGGEGTSARGLERALLRWLTLAAAVAPGEPMEHLVLSEPEPQPEVSEAPPSRPRRRSATRRPRE